MFDLDKCWAVVEARDATADGRFYYGVKTTGGVLPTGLPVAKAVARQYRLFRNDRGG